MGYRRLVYAYSILESCMSFPTLTLTHTCYLLLSSQHCSPMLKHILLCIVVCHPSPLPPLFLLYVFHFAPYRHVPRPNPARYIEGP